MVMGMEGLLIELLFRLSPFSRAPFPFHCPLFDGGYTLTALITHTGQFG